MRNVCDRCKHDFDDRLPGTRRKVTGWVVERTDGGANAVRGKKYLGPVICPPCGKEIDLGIDPAQESLL
jgi:hypothetical protein